MRTALVILSLVAAIAAEAPYHLPRPAAQAQPFNYPPAPAPPPQAYPAPAPAPQFPPQQQFIPNFGYNYQAPIQAPIQAPQYIQPAPQPHAPPPPPPQAAHHHHHHHPAPAPGYSYSAPAPQPLPIAPQPLPIAPQPLPLNPPHHQHIFHQNNPSPYYGSPQPIAARAPPPPPAPAPLPVFAPQPAPQPQPQPQVQQPIAYYQSQQQPQQQQQYSQQGYNYQQPEPIALFQSQAQAQPAHSAAPVLSSYQADSHQYSTAQEQIHREALDSLVVNRVQNIIKDNEHSVARNAGYQSLVSGVSLEQAKPSVEITSFVHTSPLVTGSSASSEVSGLSGFSATSSLPLAPSLDYGIPSAPAPVHSAESTVSSNFVPQNKPAISYGPPN